MIFALVDLSNLFHRARHGVAADPETRAGMALHVLFRSLRKLHRDLRADHIVFAVDDGSWRYAVYPGYKARRRIERATADRRTQEDDEIFFRTLDRLIEYLDHRTRCSLLRASQVEGDDFIARWITRHPQYDHIIVSGDSDFVQLLAPNVKIFDALNQRLIGTDAIVDENARTLAFTVNPQDGKIKVGAPTKNFTPESDWWRKALFIKLIRGDTGDSIFSAYPGVRYEGKKCSIRAAWEDRFEQGYDWNNLMFQSWEKLVGAREDGSKLLEQVTVRDEFRRNEHLIDLTKQPDWVCAMMDDVISGAQQKPPINGVGPGFLRFCAQNDLPTLEREATDHVRYLNAGYPRQDLR